MCIVLLPLKLQPQQTTSVEMRVKTVRPVQIRCFLPIVFHPKLLTEKRVISAIFWTPQTIFFEDPMSKIENKKMM